MPLKIVPQEIRLEFRSYVLRYALMIAIPTFVAISLGDYAVYAWVAGNYGNTIIVGLIALGSTIVSASFIMIRIGKHELQLNHSQDDIQFWVDHEAVQLGYMTMQDFMRKHSVRMAKLIKMQSDYLNSLHVSDTKPPILPPISQTKSE